MLDQDLRSHLLNCHGEDLRVLRNLAGDLYELGGSAGGAATSMQCPMSGCKHRIALIPPPLPALPPVGAGGPAAEPSTSPAGRFLTGDALKSPPQGPSHTSAAAVTAPPGSLELEVAMHLVSEHLLELQALAALSDSMTLRAFSRNACPFHALGPRACHGVHNDSGGPAAAAAVAPGGVQGGGGAPARPDLGSGGSPGLGGPTPQGRRGSPAARQSPVVSPTKRLFLTSRPGTPTRSAVADGSLAAADAMAPAGGPGSVDWWGHMRSHLPDLVATVGSVLQRSEDAAGSAADALSPKVTCDVPGCTIYFQVSHQCDFV